MTFALTTRAVECIATLTQSKRMIGANAWVYAEEGSVYLRATQRLSPHRVVCNTIDVATVDINEDCQQQGVFKEMLQALEQYAQQNNRCVYVESVLNEQLLHALLRYGYTEIPNSIPPCLWKSHEMLTAQWSPLPPARPKR